MLKRERYLPAIIKIDILIAFFTKPCLDQLIYGVLNNSLVDVTAEFVP